MSDTGADDSGFDKEAERERLREKYGDADEDQAATERMSELLLQGATMTNRHCGECGNPIFRYEGQSFCAVCEEARPQDGQGNHGEHAERSAGTDTQDADTTATPSDAPGQDLSEPASETEFTDRMREQTEQPPSPTEFDARPDPESVGPDEVPAPEHRARRGDARPEGPVEEPTADLQAARASLLRTLNRMADQAESTAEVDRSRDYLAAAREAAEALAALDRVRQR